MCSIIFKLFSITFFLEKLFLYFLLLLNLSQSICKILNFFLFNVFIKKVDIEDLPTPDNPVNQRILAGIYLRYIS